jgi:hypothetical protein
MAMKRHSCGDVTTTSRVNESRHYDCNFIFTIDKNPKDKLTWVNEIDYWNQIKDFEVWIHGPRTY